MVVPLVAFSLGTGGCVVTTAKYEAKTREADSLRDALASASKEKNSLETRNEAIRKQLSEEEERNTALSSRNRELEEDLGDAKEELASISGKYEGTRITREELISELLEKEKATGKRIQELGATAQRCEMERERLQKEAVERQDDLSALEKRVAETPDSETLRRERDILLGRIERIKEERLQEADVFRYILPDRVGAGRPRNGRPGTGYGSVPEGEIKREQRGEESGPGNGEYGNGVSRCGDHRHGRGKVEGGRDPDPVDQGPLPAPGTGVRGRGERDPGDRTVARNPLRGRHAGRRGSAGRSANIP